MYKELYESIVREGDIRRTAYRDGIEAYIDRLKEESLSNRGSFMPMVDFSDKLEEYRAKYIAMLGIDKISCDGAPSPSLELIGKDDDAIIHRAVIYITKEIPLYGLLFVPHGAQRTPLVIAQHGGSGTPELCSDMNGENKYNHMVRRLIKRGATVFAPQILKWNFREDRTTHPCHPIPYDRNDIDKDLKHFGMSVTALEIKGIMNAISFISTLPFIDKENIGMMGISYGGYFTLHTMAADKRIKVGFSNACFNDRNIYSLYDWTYFNSANTFHDAQIAALCAPRRLYVAVGKEDETFGYKSAVSEAEYARKYFEALGYAENFVFNLWDGGHTMPLTDEGIDFIFSTFK